MNDWMNVILCTDFDASHQSLTTKGWVHAFTRQHESMSNEGGKGGGGGRKEGGTWWGVGVRGVNRECISFCLQSFLPISILSTEKTHQAARRECKQRTRDRQQGISNVNLLWPSEYILNA